MTDDKPSGVPRALGLKPSGLLLTFALADLLVIVPYTYWRLNGHRLVLIIVYAVEGIALLSMLGIGLHLRRRGSLVSS